MVEYIKGQEGVDTGVEGKEVPGQDSYVTLVMDVDRDISEATIESASEVIREEGENRELFDIRNVFTLDDRRVGGKQVNVSINTEDELLGRGDIIIFMSNMRELGERVAPSKLHISPTIGSEMTRPEGNPRLIVEFKSERASGKSLQDKVSDAMGEAGVVDYDIAGVGSYETTRWSAIRDGVVELDVGYVYATAGSMSMEQATVLSKGTGADVAFGAATFDTEMDLSSTQI